MIVVQNRVQVGAEHAATFEEAFRRRAGAVDDTPGFVRNMVLRPTGEGDPYIVLTMWESRAAFEAWVGSDAFSEAHRGARGAGGPGMSSALEVHEVILDTDDPELEAGPLAGAAAG